MILTKKRLMALSLVALVMAVIALIGCTPKATDTADSGTTADTSTATAGVWSTDSDCELCHANAKDSLQDVTTLAGMHTGTTDCLTCHDDTPTLATVHDGATEASTAKKLKKTEVNSGTCTTSGCHDDATDRIATTASLTTLTDSAGLTVNPHDLPAVADHDLVTCSVCHSGHKTMPDAKKSCLTCHHKDVFECNTCHD